MLEFIGQHPIVSVIIVLIICNTFLHAVIATVMLLRGDVKKE